ncbi:hypothetical protein H072_6631 [Dactylellina haptotyla CBS 200.50]|uniref:NADH dehydrogenase [ubiquinone] iron-sulfur protein 5 n=1 Tax=Dactylellina haptotyla (strain CBS 200.50) TaxID=1284197 RepID=S8A9N3_DACHA|nr:hypothetical protein H072_6631 [Dactylellina haptotyla CBS 200.50]
MASGYGNTGGITRCFPFWQDVLACYVMNTSKESDANKYKCAGYREDYYECLHHTKEINKISKMNEAIKRYEQGLGHVRDDAEMAKLGLVKGSYDPKKIDLQPGTPWKN